MNEERRKPSLTRILRSDYVALLGLLFPAVAWAMYIATEYFGFLPGIGRHGNLTRSDAPFFLYFGLAATVIGLPLLVWRIRSIQKLFANGVETTGQITNVAFRRDRGRVEYTYTHLDQVYSSGNAIQRTSQTENLAPGAPVNLMIDPENPSRSLIRDLYV